MRSIENTSAFRKSGSGRMAGDPWTISGYLGNGGQFDDAMGKFALAYADQAERDHAALKAAVRAGIVEVQLEH